MYSMHSLFGNSQMFHYNLFKEFFVSIVGRNDDAISISDTFSILPLNQLNLIVTDVNVNSIQNRNDLTNQGCSPSSTLRLPCNDQVSLLLLVFPVSIFIIFIFPITQQTPREGRHHHSVSIIIPMLKDNVSSRNHWWYAVLTPITTIFFKEANTKEDK